MVPGEVAVSLWEGLYVFVCVREEYGERRRGLSSVTHAASVTRIYLIAVSGFNWKEDPQHA